jgi:hypothetical protein
MDRVDETGGFIDIGSGVQHQVGMTSTKFSTAVAIAKANGYEVHKFKVPQATVDHMTELKVLGPPGSTQKEAWMNRDKVQQLQKFFDQREKTYFEPQPPMSLDSSRIKVRYAEEGGTEADDVLYIRPGVEDVSIGANRYAQVRVAVDGTHYLKGMAVYKDDLPPGVDVVFNTNKSNTGDPKDAMKKFEIDKATGEIDPKNPFGAQIRNQIIRTDEKGNEVLTSTMNLVNEEGAWRDWNKALSSQILSKQNPRIAKEQLDLAVKTREQELDEILSLTNPEVKRRLLNSFADTADSDAVDLAAAAMSRQDTHVLIPIPGMKDNEVYAPNYRNGETVVLFRHPHGGTFEALVLKVNNNVPDAVKLLGKQADDAIGINAKVASIMSGADFDGDAVIVIPDSTGKLATRQGIKRSSPLLDLQNFDPKKEFPSYPGMKPISDKHKQKEMGVVSNLITDMTIKKASDAEIARAVRHSMVIIDAEKHKLNWKQSERDNNIAELKAKYQPEGGAATIVSRASSPQYVPRRVLRKASEGGPVDPKTGRLVYVPTGEEKWSRPNKAGERKLIPKTEKRDRMLLVDDARQLSSGTPVERIYADYANQMKGQANRARLAALKTKSNPANPSAKKTYAVEVESINAKLRLAQANRPRERQAQVLTDAVVRKKKAADPEMTKDREKRIKQQTIKEMRNRTGADKAQIRFTDKEWRAVQEGAISPTKLKEIMGHADLQELKKLATPRTQLSMTTPKLQRAQSMIRSGYTQAEIADALGVSLSTLKRGLNDG